jgi:hypothetical protein
MALGAAFGSLGTVIGLWALLRVLAADGPLQLNDVTVARADFLPVAVLFLIIYISACLTAAAASWALWKRRARSRHLLVALLVEFIVGDTAMLVFMSRTLDVTRADLAASALFFAFLVALGLWYLFRKESVVQYYESVLSTKP